MAAVGEAMDGAVGKVVIRPKSPGRAIPERAAVAGATPAPDILAPDEARGLEKFIPITRHALIDRLSKPHLWSRGEAGEARRFFAFLDYWRHQKYTAGLLDLEQDYEPFSPDSDLLITRQLTDGERQVMQKRVVEGTEDLLRQANYVRINPTDVELILTKDSAYGLDLFVDMHAFEEILIYYRGASTRTDQRRTLRKFLRKEEFETPIFQRLFVLFKIKTDAQRVEDLMRDQKLSLANAEKAVKKLRALLPASVKDGNIYMKLFKNMPRSDIEMVFPNTRVRFRTRDKIKLGLTTGGAFGMGVFGAAGKLALALTNPLAAAGAAAGLGGIAIRQGMNFLNQRQRYMMVLAQNLYFHSLADNRSVMIKLADRAAEEDIKEELLLYSVLAKEQVNRSELPHVDRAIEQYLLNHFGVKVNFDLEDALSRLLADGIVSEDANGNLTALRPREASRHIDKMWDGFLDNLPGATPHEGVEMEIDADEAAPELSTKLKG